MKAPGDTIAPQQGLSIPGAWTRRPPAAEGRRRRAIQFARAAVVTAALAGPAAAQPCSPEWGALGVGLAGGPANALAVYDDGSGPALYVGGGFTSAGGATANRVARWDGESWSALLSVNNTVITLGVFDDGAGPALYAGGVFTMAGGAPAARIAKWDGASWSPLGSGATSNVQALAVFDDGAGPALYAGGVFLTAGGIEVNRIAKWDGETWSPLGTGMDGTIQKLVVFDDGTGAALYAAGFFTEAGGVAGTAYLARWDGASWSALGSGVDGVVRALGVFDDGGGEALYAAIDWYATPTGIPVSRIAKWDGDVWTDVGPGPTNGSIVDFAVFDDGTGAGAALYAAGTFTTVAGLSAARVARWDGESWSPLGSGISGAGNVVNALAQFDRGAGRTLYATGGFTTAGGLAASRIARWQGCPPAACYPDCDESGDLDFFDFLCFQDAFGAMDPYADCDENGVHDFFDFLCFQNEFAAGCP